MADGISAYNVAPPVAQQSTTPDPGLAPTPFVLPANYTSNIPPPQLTGPSLPPQINYTPTQAPASDNPLTNLPEASHPPPFMQVLKHAEDANGRQLTPEEFDKLSTDYKTNFAVPALNAQFKGKKANVDAETAAFDNQIQHLRDQRYAATDEKSKSPVSDFLKSAGQEGFAATVPGTAAFFSRILGGLTSGEGLAPNKVSDFFNHQGSPESGLPPAVAAAGNPGDAGKAFAQIILGNNYGNPGFNDLRQKLEAQGAQQYSGNVPSAGQYEAQLGDAARKRSELGSTAGDIASLLTVFLGNEAAATKLARLPELAANASKLAKTARLLPAAAATATRTASDTAASNVDRGDDLSKVLPQFAADQTLGTAFNLLPANAPGNLLVRALTGGGIGAAQQATQSTVDQAINPNNQAPTGKDYATSAGFAAALAAILGGRGGNKLKKTPAPAEGETPTPGAPSAAAPEAPQPTPGTGQGATAPAAPVDYNASLAAGAPDKGIETTALVKLQATVLENANAQAKKYKTEISNATTPEKVVTGAQALAPRLTGKSWDTLSAEQRDQTVETVAAWIAKKTKVPAEDVDTHLQSLRTPTPVDTSAAPSAGVTEQPLPADITGQQVPDTVAQAAPAPTPDITGQTHTPGYQPKAQYDDLWNRVNSGAKDLTPAESILQQAVQSGKVTTREQFDNVLEQAKTKSGAKKTNALRAKPAEEPAAPATPPISNPEANHEAVSRTVADALADNSTPEDTRNKLKAKAKELTEGQYNQAYLKAIANRDSAPSDAGEAQIRKDPSFNAAADAVRQGKINTPADLGKFLKENKGTSTVGDGLAGNELKQVGALLANKSTKSDIVAARKAVRTTVLEPLVKLGEDPAAINKMTVGEATAHLQKLANTFTSDTAREAVTPKKTLKKADVKPVDDPDKPTPPPKKTLKKTNVKPVEEPVVAKKGLKGETKGPKSEAPADTAGASTPLEAKIHERLGDVLPQHTIDELHDAVSEAQVGDKGNLTDLITGLRSSGDIGNAEAKWLRELANEKVQYDLTENNASGESSASLEAQHRLADEKSAGQTRAIIRRDGSVEPLHGVDAVDTHARQGEVIAQRGIGKDEWTVLSHGNDLSKYAVEGRINRYREDLNDVHTEVRKGPQDEAPERSGEHTLSLEDFDDLQHDRTDRDKGTPRESDRVTTIQTSRRIDKVIRKIQAGADIHETGAELQKLADELDNKRTQQKFKEAFRDRRRGPEWVKAQLQRMVADYPEDSSHYKAGKFALWLLDKSPRMADDLAFSLREKIPGDSAGYFNPLSRLIGINSTGTNPTTAVHEILHASERLMPAELQDKVRGEYIGRLQNKLKQQIKAGNRWAQLYVQTAIKDFASPSKYNHDVMMNILKEHSKDVPVNEYYKYFNPSEYWAVEGTDILNRKYEANSWIAKAKDWVDSFIQQVKNLFGFDNNAKIREALDRVTDANGLPPAAYSGQLAEKVNVQRDISPVQEGENPTDEQLGYESAKDADVDPNMVKEAPKKQQGTDLGKVNTAQHFVEQSMKADYGLEKAMQALRRKGVNIKEEHNVEDAAYRKNGLVSEYNSKDFDETFNPVSDWVYANKDKYAKNTQEFTDRLNKFYQNTHFLERVHTDWVLESPLSGTAGYDRADILEQVSKGEIDPVKANKQLEELASKNSEYTPEEWAKQNNVPIDTMNKELGSLDKLGINKKSMDPLNKLMDRARERTTQRLTEAGLVDKDDPWTKLYGWDWYVPLKGSAYGGGPDNNFDLIPSKRIALGRLNQQMNVMDGRSSFAERPFSRLFVDMARAGERQANSQLLDKVYNLAVDHGDKIGAKIETFTGRPKDGYKNTRTGEEVERLKAPASGVIVNDGDTHYVITLPKDSQLVRGLVQMNNVERPNALEKQISKGTNVLARLYTTIHPAWQTFSGFIRDLTYIPITLGASKYTNPFEAIPLWAKYSGNVLQAYKALPTLVPHLLGQSNKLRQMGAADPNSWAGWTRRYEEAGGANQFTKGFDVAGTENLLKGKLKDIDGVLDAGKWTWNKALEYSGNYANFLEGIGRVAMFKTLVETGHTETDAAVQVRKLLDYSQSGIKGRRINSWLAFFRVGMTGADAMRRAFTKPTGGLDYKKMAAWQGFMGALGSVGYMAASAMLGQDEDGKDVISKIDPSQLTQKILFPLGGKVAGVNLGLGLPQVLMAPGILAAAVAAGHLKTEDAVKAYADTLARNGPITPAGTKGHTPTDLAASYALGFTPTLIRPLVDIERNTTTFNSSIHNDTDGKKYASDSGRAGTPQEFKDMAEWLHDATDGKIDYHPEDIRYMIQSYGGQWATDFTKLALSNPDQSAGAPEEPNRLAGKLFVDTSHYMQNEMYDTLGQLQDSKRRYASLVTRATEDGASPAQAKSQADAAVAKDPQFKAELQAFSTLDKARTAYTAQINALRSNKLISDTRKQLVRKQLDSQMRIQIEKAQNSIPTD